MEQKIHEGIGSFPTAFIWMIAVILAAVSLAMEPQIKVEKATGIFVLTNSDVAQIDDPEKSDIEDMIVPIHDEALHAYRAFYPLGFPNHGEEVVAFRLWAKIKTTGGVYKVWVFPTQRLKNIQSLDFSISRHSGEYGVLTHESGENVGIIRETIDEGSTQYLIPLDDSFPNYVTTSFKNAVPVVGENISFLVFKVKINAAANSVWTLNIVR